MIDYEGMVREFHIKYGHYKNDKPFNGDKFPSFPRDLVVLREKLITEEAKEFALASYDAYDTLDTIPLNIVEVADALADLLYVVFGAAIAYGIPIEAVFAEVHRSNMSKSTQKNEYGKTIKGPDYQPPDILSALKTQTKSTTTEKLE